MCSTWEYQKLLAHLLEWICCYFCTSITVPINYLLENYVLREGALSILLGDSFKDIDLFLSFIMFIAVIASMVQLVEMT